MRRRLVVGVAVLATGCAGQGDSGPAPAAVWKLGRAAEPVRSQLVFEGTYRRHEAAVAFDGTTGFAHTGTPGPVDTSRSFSVTAWVSLSRRAEFPTAVSQLGDVAAAFYLGYVEGSAWAFTMKTADTNRGDVTVRAVSAPARPDPRTWVHLAGIHDRAAGELRLYVDGEPVASAAIAATWAARGPLTIGRSQAHAAAEGYWPGAIAEVRTYDEALDDAAVAAAMDAGRPATPPPAAPQPPPGFHCPHDGGACLGPLAAGTYTTSVFRPRLTYTVSEGWENGEDLLGNVLLRRAGDERYLGIYRTIAAPDGCQEQPDPAVGASVEALADWLTGHPLLRTTKPRSVHVGGLSGIRIDVSAPPGTTLCPGRGVPVLVGGDPSSLTHDLRPATSLRLVLLRYDDDNVAIEISPEGGDLAEYVREVAPVLESLRFG